ncbi:WRKY Transcription Factor [Ranunculus cassubicifolius]
MKAFAGSENLQSKSPVPVEGQCHSAIVASSALVINENEEPNSHELSLTVYDPNVVEFDAVNHNSEELVEVPVAVTEIHDTHSQDNEIQDNQVNDKGVCALRSWEDGFNWRKYGQKHIKGNEFPRSYYRCSHPNCQVKKQVEQSHDGRITDVIYRGKHNHPNPQSVSNTATCTTSSVQGERSNVVSISGDTKDDLSSNENCEAYPHDKVNCVPDLSKPNGNHQLSVVMASNKNVGGPQVRNIRGDIQNNDDDDHTDSKRRCLELIRESGVNSGTCSESLETNPALCEAVISSFSNQNATIIDVSHETNPSKALVLAEVDLGDSHETKGANVGVQGMHIDHKSPLVPGDRLLGDGYNWRKYGQKQIKGSDIPRSYYRCTHPNCQVKKQLECSQDGQVTDIVYKGEHNHPKPQPSSHIAVGRILSIQEGVEILSSINHTHEKSITGQQTSFHTEQKSNSEHYPVEANEADVNSEGSTLKRTYDKVEQNVDLDTECEPLTVDAEVSQGGMSNEQCKPFVKIEGQSKSGILVNEKDTALATPTSVAPITVSNSPVYMVTSRGIVPVGGVDSEEKHQTQSSDDKGLSVSMTERLLENAYHWRKYGQKNIKGSEFPRSYYRCTHPNCQVKMQLERSHDGRIIEIIYKGKHDHPKPQPITRMAIGAILSLEEHDKSSLSEDKNVPQVLRHIPNLSIFTKNVEDDMDPQSKRRKKDMAGDEDVVVTPVSRTPREPRVIVETLTEVDVVEDGYRWQKYGRKNVKGNSHPRNYYRCSNGGCSVKKHVERAASNPKAVITTYEGKHNHELPPARITTHDTGGILFSTTSSTFGRELVVNGNTQDSKREDILEVKPIQTQSIDAPVAKEDIVMKENDSSDIHQSLEHNEEKGLSSTQ